MAKIEVVIDGDQVPAHHQGRLLFNDRASQSMLITVVPEDKVPSLPWTAW